MARESKGKYTKSKNAKPSTSLETRTRVSLLKEARSHDISGLSSMSKAETVTASQGK